MTLPSVLVIGCGNMAGAMLRRWVESDTLALDAVAVVTRTKRDLPTGVVQWRMLPPGYHPDIVLLGVKPQQLDAAAADYAGSLGRIGMLISILAGVGEARLASRFDADTIVRAVPNLPVAMGQGVVALHSTSENASARDRIEHLMHPLGLVEWVGEQQLDAVTALAGSGPAFVYRFIDALAAAGAENGIPADQAARLALATVNGAAMLAAAADVSPAILADRVASPGGSTRKGLDVLDAPLALNRILSETLDATTRRNAELGRNGQH